MMRFHLAAAGFEPFLAVYCIYYQKYCYNYDRNEYERTEDNSPDSMKKMQKTVALYLVCCKEVNCCYCFAAEGVGGGSEL